MPRFGKGPHNEGHVHKRGPGVCHSSWQPPSAAWNQEHHCPTNCCRPNTHTHTRRPLAFMCGSRRMRSLLGSVRRRESSITEFMLSTQLASRSPSCDERQARPAFRAAGCLQRQPHAPARSEGRGVGLASACLQSEFQAPRNRSAPAGSTWGWCRACWPAHACCRTGGRPGNSVVWRTVCGREQQLLT